MKTNLIRLAAAFSALMIPQGGFALVPTEVLESPDRSVVVTFTLEGGEPVYAVSYHQQPLLVSSPMSLELKPKRTTKFAQVNASRTQVRDMWRPLYGEQAVLPDRYNALVIELRENGTPERRVQVELRAYDEGVALRYRVDGTAGGPVELTKEQIAFNFVPDTVAWPIKKTEGIYPQAPVKLAEYKGWMQLPLTVRTPAGYAAVLEADVRDYPRLQGVQSNGGVSGRLLGEYRGDAGICSPWRVLLIGREAIDLVRNQNLIATLNPPATGNFSWVKTGKMLSAIGNFKKHTGIRRMETGQLKKMIDWAAAQNFKYIQLDWGWNATEAPWTNEERAAYREQVPAAYRESGWEANTTGDLTRVASGYVPFRPNPKTQGVDILVDLDMPALIAYGKAKGVGLSLYANSRWSLPKQDMDLVMATQARWGVEGLKPGFVHYGTQENSAWLLRLLRTAAQHRLTLNIHDEYLPDGSWRTYPNLLSCEAGAGAENKPPVSHDLALPFTRGLAGPYDYTPHIYTSGRSNMYHMAYMLVLYNPAPVIRGGFSAWDDAGSRGGVELEFLRELPDTWDESRMLFGEIGQNLGVARRQGTRWFLGALTADQPLETAVKLDFLKPATDYILTYFEDAPGAGLERSAVKKNRLVHAGETIKLSLQPAGGWAGWLETNAGQPATRL